MSSADNIPTITVSAGDSGLGDSSTSSGSSVLVPSSRRTTSLPTAGSSSTALQSASERLNSDGSSEEEHASKKTVSLPKASSDDANLPRTHPGPPISMKHGKQHKGRKVPLPKTMDDKTPLHGALDYSPQKEQVVVFPSKSVYASPNIPYNNSWAFQRAITSSDAISSGFVFLQVSGEKARKNVKENSYVFIVLEGTVEATINQSHCAVSTGGVFLVPTGNEYSIRNISDKEAKLFFAQTRKAPVAGEGTVWRLERSSSKSFMLLQSLLQWIKFHIAKLRSQGFAWYWKYLARYQHYLTGRKLYFICFVLGLVVRRLPFVGSPPILNIQFVRIR